MREPIQKIIPSKLETGFERLVYRLFMPLVPARATPNGITTLGGLFSLFGIVSGFLSGRCVFFLIGTIAGLLGHLICDDLDGYVAKQRNMQSDAGAYYDLIVDVLHLTCLLIALSFSNIIHWKIGICLVPVYALILFTSMNEIHYLNIFRFPAVGPFEAHLYFIALCVVGMTLREPVVYGLRAADLLAILGGIPMCFEMFRLQIKLFRDLKKRART